MKFYIRKIKSKKLFSKILIIISTYLLSSTISYSQTTGDLLSNARGYWSKTCDQFVEGQIFFRFEAFNAPDYYPPNKQGLHLRVKIFRLNLAKLRADNFLTIYSAGSKGVQGFDDIYFSVQGGDSGRRIKSLEDIENLKIQHNPGSLQWALVYTDNQGVLRNLHWKFNPEFTEFDQMKSKTESGSIQKKCTESQFKSYYFADSQRKLLAQQKKLAEEENQRSEAKQIAQIVQNQVANARTKYQEIKGELKTEWTLYEKEDQMTGKLQSFVKAKGLLAPGFWEATFSCEKGIRVRIKGLITWDNIYDRVSETYYINGRVRINDNDVANTGFLRGDFDNEFRMGLFESANILASAASSTTSGDAIFNAQTKSALAIYLVRIGLKTDNGEIFFDFSPYNPAINKVLKKCSFGGGSGIENFLKESLR